MKYDDEQILSIEGYENMARAYSNFMKQKGFVIIKVDDNENKALIEQTFDLFSNIKNHLFRLGGFLNTGKLYSLTNRQISKFEIIFDKKLPKNNKFCQFDKTKCFLSYIGYEFALIKNLIALKDQSNFESDILRIINDRLSSLKDIFSN